MNSKDLIVIHEDDDLIRELMERWLVEAGYAVRAAGDEPPSLVIANVPSPARAQPLIQALQAAYCVFQPNVNTKASTPGSTNSISNWRSTTGFDWRISWYSRCSVTVPLP